MIVARTRIGLEQSLSRFRSEQARVGLVPTMGFLHPGHLSLVDRARKVADRTLVTIFVNPLQFGPSEDLDSYPRDEARDLDQLKDHGVDLAFVPDVDEMYPGGPPRVTVNPGVMGRRLCGAHRPGHFAGVLTVVAKLFGLVRPDVAVFGQKDFQQAALIRRMVRDLELRVRVETAPIVREADGLAMSSRNSYLSPEERAQAPVLHQALDEAVARYGSGERSAHALLAEIQAQVASRDQLQLQYAEAVDPDTLEPRDPVTPGTVLALAAFCGTTRLIDNVRLGGG